MFIDTHCHLDFPEFDQDRDEVIKRAKSQGIEYIINIGSSIEGSKKSLELAKKYDCIYATVGIHPHASDRFAKLEEATLRELAKKDKVVAIGEIGLDYYLPAGRQGKNYSKGQNQRLMFISLLQLAKDLDLPLVIHSRQAQDDTLSTLKEAMPVKGVVHCFSGDEVFLRDCLALSFFISFTCNITYRKADNLRNLVKITPLERLLLETDAPFLPPEGLRGRRNEPFYVKNLAREIAKIKEISIEEIAEVTTKNAKQFFNIP
jgi:TatD DNase family protein